MADWSSRAILFVRPGDLESERLQLVNYLKGSLCQIEVVHNPNDEIIRFNPTLTFPILTDHGLALTGNSRLDAFFEERYPGSPLLPNDVMQRAVVRMIADEITDCYVSFATDPTKAIDKIKEFATAFHPEHRWFCGPSINFIDCAIAPFFKRLDQLNILWNPTSAISDYHKRLTALLTTAISNTTPCPTYTPEDLDEEYTDLLTDTPTYPTQNAA